MLQLGLLVLLGFFLHVVCEIATAFNEDFYAQGVLITAALKDRKFVGGLLITLVPLALFARRTSWQSGREERALRLLVAAIALLISWQLATVGYNYYFDQGHTFDRLLLLALAAGTALHPLFLPPLIFQLYLFGGQLEHPLGGYDWTDKQLFFRLLIYVEAACVLRIFARVRPATIFFFLALVCNASYFFAGVQKLQLSPSGYEWLTEDSVGNLVQAARLNGWGAPAGEAATHLLAGASFLATLPALLIEVGSAAVFYSSRLFAVFSAAHILLHAMIALLSGIFFWKWAVLQLVFLAALPVFSRSRPPIFSRRAFVVSLPFFLLAPFLFAPPALGWFDTNYVTVYRVFSVKPSAAELEIAGDFFGPYDLLLKQGRFYYLSRRPMLTGTYGGTSNYFLFKKLEEELSDEQLDTLVKREGELQFDGRRRREFCSFLRRFLEGYNFHAAAGETEFFADLFAAPSHIYAFPPGDRHPEGRPISSVRVRELVYYRGRLVDSRIVAAVDLKGEGAADGC